MLIRILKNMHPWWGLVIVFSVTLITFGFLVGKVELPSSTGTSTALAAAVTPKEGELALFGSIPYWDQDAAVAVFKEHADQFDVISLFWYRLDEEGRIVPYSSAVEDESIIRFAHTHGVKALALIANLPEEGDWDARLVGNVIMSPERRSAHIGDIVALVEAKGFDGVNIDYEFLRNRQTQEFSAFIEELARALHARDKILAVAIHPQEPNEPTRGQDLERLGHAADILAVMAFDEHWPGSQPGPVASLPWVKDVLTYTIGQGVDPKRIYLCVPLFGYDWDDIDGSAGVGLEYENVRTLAEDTGVSMRYNSALQSPFFFYESDGVAHEVWFENAESFSAKVELAKNLGLGGLALWRLGREDQEIYNVFEE